jgi:hypothetical protein
LNETVKLTIDELEDIEAAVYKNHGFKGMNMINKGDFNKKLSRKQMKMLQWEAFFNRIFRYIC